MYIPEESPEEKCVRYLHSLNTTKPNMDCKSATSTPKLSQNFDIASTFFMKLFSSDKNNQTKNDTVVKCDGDESSSDDGLLNSLVCNTKLFSDESSAESEYDGGLEQLIDECLLYQDWDGIENKLRNYLKKNKGKLSLVDSLRIVRLVTQTKIRRKLTNIVLKHFKQGKYKMKIKSRAASKQSSTERNVETEHVEEDSCTEVPNEKHKLKMKCMSCDVSTRGSSERELSVKNVNHEQIEADSRSEEPNEKHRSTRRRSDRILSRPPGYFQTKPGAVFYILTPEVPKKRKSYSSHSESDRKKKKANNADLVDSTPGKQNKRKRRGLNEDEDITIDENQNNKTQPELVGSDDEEDSVVQPKKEILASPVHKINTKKSKLPVKIPPSKGNTSRSLPASKNHSDDEQSPLVVDGHVKKRHSKKTSVKSRLSLPDLSRLNKSSDAAEDDNKRRSTRLSSHPPDFFKTKPACVFYIYPSDDSEDEAVEQRKKRLSSSKPTRKLFSGDSG